MKKLLTLAFVSAMLYACNSITDKSVKYTDRFAFEDSTSLTTVKTVEVEAINIWNWQTNGNRIYIQTSGQDSIVRIFDYPDLESRQVCFGRIGHASGEFIVTNWCETESGFGLYDMMQKKLFLYNVSNEKVAEKAEYRLPTDEKGLALPFTYISQFNDSLFLMKCDGQESDLCLINMKSGKEISRYHCDIRPKNDRPYTPYSYKFAYIGNTVCIAYEHLDRVEFVNVTDDMQLKPVCIIGEDGKAEMPADFSNLKRCFSSITKSNDSFFCLRNAKKESGSTVYEFSTAGDMKRIIKLDKKVSTILAGEGGLLLGYQEKENSGNILVYKTK